MNSVASCQRVIDSQVSMLQTLAQETQDMRDAAAELQMHTRPVQDSVATLKAQARKLTSEAKESAPEKAVRSSQQQW